MKTIVVLCWLAPSCLHVLLSVNFKLFQFDHIKTKPSNILQATVNGQKAHQNSFNLEISIGHCLC
ncbi:hypothetical protein M758_8G091200 [Ceratodon purpureus]|nr:hypothetical protein M758_8G091200 [Ceratodon purpureus]